MANEHMDQTEREAFWEEVKADWSDADTTGNGTINIDELRAVMAAHGPPTLAQKAGKEAGKEAGKRRGPPAPSAEDVMRDCDADEDTELTKEEAKDCIDREFEHMAEGLAAFHEAVWTAVEAHWVDADTNGNGTIDLSELTEAMAFAAAHGDDAADTTV